jgi:hypothetical protein
MIKSMEDEMGGASSSDARAEECIQNNCGKTRRKEYTRKL